MAGWADSHGLVDALLMVEDAFAQQGMTVYTVVLATALLLVRAPREALLVVASMIITALATGALKNAFDRPRPGWQEAPHALGTASFPSGHASSITALTAALLVVALALTSERRQRPLLPAVTAGLGASLVLVVGADRVLLGRHFPTDVLGGLLLGLVVVLSLATALGLEPRGGRDRSVTSPAG